MWIVWINCVLSLRVITKTNRSCRSVETSSITVPVLFTASELLQPFMKAKSTIIIRAGTESCPTVLGAIQCGRSPNRTRRSAAENNDDHLWALSRRASVMTSTHHPISFSFQHQPNTGSKPWVKARARNHDGFWMSNKHNQESRSWSWGRVTVLTNQQRAVTEVGAVEALNRTPDGAVPDVAKDLGPTARTHRPHFTVENWSRNTTALFMCHVVDGFVGSSSCRVGERNVLSRCIVRAHFFFDNGDEPVSAALKHHSRRNHTTLQQIVKQRTSWVQEISMKVTTDKRTITTLPKPHLPPNKPRGAPRNTCWETHVNWFWLCCLAPWPKLRSCWRARQDETTTSIRRGRGEMVISNARLDLSVTTSHEVHPERGHPQRLAVLLASTALRFGENWSLEWPALACATERHASLASDLDNVRDVPASRRSASDLHDVRDVSASPRSAFYASRWYGLIQAAKTWKGHSRDGHGVRLGSGHPDWRAGPRNYLGPAMSARFANNPSRFREAKATKSVLVELTMFQLLLLCHQASEGIEAKTLGPSVHSQRHKGASPDQLTNERSLTGVQLRGCWKAVSSLRRYKRTASWPKSSPNWAFQHWTRSIPRQVSCWSITTRSSHRCARTPMSVPYHPAHPHAHECSLRRAPWQRARSLGFRARASAHVDIGRPIVFKIGQEWFMIGICYAVVVRPPCTTPGEKWQTLRCDNIWERWAKWTELWLSAVKRNLVVAAQRNPGALCCAALYPWFSHQPCAKHPLLTSQSCRSPRQPCFTDTHSTSTVLEHVTVVARASTLGYWVFLAPFHNAISVFVASRVPHQRVA